MVFHNLLLVDDEANILTSLQREFKKEGYGIFTAPSGKDGLNIMERETISLVVSDQKMPEMNGVEFLNKVKEDWPDAMRIMLTGHASIKVAVDAINRGEIYRFVIKPWNDLELKSIIRQALNHYELVENNSRLHELTSRQNVELKELNENLEKKVKERTRTISEQKDELIKFNQDLERKVIEKTEQLREKDIQLLEMDRIAGIATLGAGIAHEINNPLSFIKSSIGSVKKGVDKIIEAVRYWDNNSHTEHLLKDYKDYLKQINFDHSVNSFECKLDRINKGIERIMKIVNSLRSFSRVDREDIGKININQSIEEVIEILGAKEMKKVEFVKELQEAPLIECSTNGINQCLLQTIQNAIDAVDDDGLIKIMTSCDKEVDQILIKIIDNGKGMSPQVLRQAFNPFFTTKPVGSGTGVGLSMIERIIKRHGGKIELSSKEGKGTTVTMLLPVVAKVKEFT